MIRVLPIAALVLLGATAAHAAPRNPVDPFRPSPDEAVRLVQGHRTNGYVTVARTLAEAQRLRPDSFRLAAIRPEQRPGESFTRVHVCYWLRNPGTKAQPRCDIGFIVSGNPGHVEPMRRFEGLDRDLQDGPDAFLRGLDRELALARDPGERTLRAVVDPFELYDWR